jgi:hypothetical protein
MDMHSGGGCKESPYEYIYIEADKNTASIIFYNRFGHNPNRVTCTCCGEDYSISSHEDLLELTEYNCRGISLEEYKQEKDVLFVSVNEIKPKERQGEVPEQGYVWQD